MEELPEKNLRLLEERDMPLRKLSMTMHQREGSRTFPMAESRSCTPRPPCSGGGLQRAAVDHYDSHGEEGTKDGKGALSLLGGNRKALKTLIMEQGTGRAGEAVRSGRADGGNAAGTPGKNCHARYPPGRS